MTVLRQSLASLGSGDCLPVSVNPDAGEGHGAAETGDPEDDAIGETINEPHNPRNVEDPVSTLPPDPPADNECYTQEDGSDYFGDVSVTVSGLECQSWAENTPHRPIKKYRGYGAEPMHPNHFGQHNHCRTLPYMAVRRGEDRNNYSGRTGPWCHTMDQEVRWEYCDVGEPQDSC
ncbi:plasminogen-like [Anneissia japonica]|uniref:plasminogen-like n=1 Tax=Anneissia japonica TaxID=1529436 RepID=UPI00142598F7|nr:plasminogen-like [Anneissia japonica]